jgi:hypothetical protein
LKEEDYFSKKLEDYFSEIMLHEKLGFLPLGVTSVGVSNVRKLSTRVMRNRVYSFMLSYQNGVLQQRSAFILKAYGKFFDPIIRSNTAPENLERCLREFQVLTGLRRVGFPVPRACLYESDIRVFGSPFIIMEKEEFAQNFSNNMDQFTRNLVWLHSLDINTLGISTLKAPESKYEFAKSSLIYLKIFLNLYPSRNKGLEKDFELAIRWLESNISNNSCDKYCLLHTDYRAHFNVVMTQNSRMIVIDWEDAEIGDPAYDVAMAYIRAREDFGEKTADCFVQEYLRHFDGSLAERLFFYKLVAYLRLAISHSRVLSNPIRAYEIRGLEAFLLFPFLSLQFVAKRTGTASDVAWVESFEDFVKENLIR